jgi:hypothetical protein
MTFPIRPDAPAGRGAAGEPAGAVAEAVPVALGWARRRSAALTWARTRLVSATSRSIRVFLLETALALAGVSRCAPPVWERSPTCASGAWAASCWVGRSQEPERLSPRWFYPSWPGERWSGLGAPAGRYGSNRASAGATHEAATR